MGDISNGTYFIKSVGTSGDHFLDGDEHSNAVAAAGSRDKWEITNDPTGVEDWSYITNVKSDRRLDLAGQAQHLGNNVIVYPKNDTPAQKWTISDVGNSYVVKYHANQDLAVKVARSRGDIINCAIATFKANDPLQQWTITKAD